MQKGMIKSLKAINFDLDSKALQKIYQSDNPFIYLKAYKQLTNSLLITALFTDNGRDIFQKENCLIMKS